MYSAKINEVGSCDYFFSCSREAEGLIRGKRLGITTKNGESGMEKNLNKEGGISI